MNGPPPALDIPDDVVRRVDPSVVAIQHERAAGSGFFVSEDGYILTNGHVVRGSDEEDPTQPARSITVILYDEQKFPARVIGFSLDPDVALIKIDPPRPMQAVTYADSRSAQVGQVCFAVGTPIGLKRTFTRGILSNVERADLGTETRVFQTDAAINPGNSGGPLFDREGRVLGINTYAGRGNNLGFTLPIHVAEVLRQHFLRHGRFVRAWVPVFLTSEIYDELARALRVERGVLISYVLPGSAAWKAGLRDGDVLVEVDGQPCNARRRVELLDFEWEQTIRNPGEPVRYTVLRGPPSQRQRLTITAKLEAMEPLPRFGRHVGELAERRYEALGLGIWPIVSLHRIVHALPDTPGVLVASVQPSSPAARAGLRQFDILSHVAGQPCADFGSFVRAFESELARRSPTIELMVTRGHRTLPTALAPHYTLHGLRTLLVHTDDEPAMVDLVAWELLAMGASLHRSKPEIPIEMATQTWGMVVLFGNRGWSAATTNLAEVLSQTWKNHGVLAAAGASVCVPMAVISELKHKRVTTAPAWSSQVVQLGGKYTGKDVETDGRWVTGTATERATVRAFLRAIHRVAWATVTDGEPTEEEGEDSSDSAEEEPDIDPGP